MNSYFLPLLLGEYFVSLSLLEVCGASRGWRWVFLLKHQRGWNHDEDGARRSPENTIVRCRHADATLPNLSSGGGKCMSLKVFLR